MSTSIVFTLEPDAWHGAATESLAASPMSSDEAGFRIDSAPLFVAGVCIGDVVSVREEAGVLHYAETLEKSANSLYRVRFAPAARPLAQALLGQLKPLGCSGEIGEMQSVVVVAIHIPAESDADAAWAILEKGETQGVWEVEEGEDRHPE